MRRPSLVILDRDGVINRDSAAFVKSADEWIALPGSIEAIADLSKAGIRVVVATNQSGLGRGLFDSTALAAMHAKMMAEVRAAGGSIEAILYCPHRPDAGCACRKPAATMISDALALTRVSAGDAVAIGDSGRDVVAASRAGVTSWLVRTGNGLETERGGAVSPDATHDDLRAAVDAVLASDPV